MLFSKDFLKLLRSNYCGLDSYEQSRLVQFEDLNYTIIKRIVPEIRNKSSNDNINVCFIDVSKTDQVTYHLLTVSIHDQIRDNDQLHLILNEVTKDVHEKVKTDPASMDRAEQWVYDVFLTMCTYIEDQKEIPEIYENLITMIYLSHSLLLVLYHVKDDILFLQEVIPYNQLSGFN